MLFVVFFGGGLPITNINYITIASEGDGIDFWKFNQQEDVVQVDFISTRGALFGGGYSNSKHYSIC